MDWNEVFLFLNDTVLVLFKKNIFNFFLNIVWTILIFKLFQNKTNRLSGYF